MDNILELKAITKKFGSLVANEGVNLFVKKGTVHAIIGENGAGKSTLMNVICGLYQPDEGAILLNGKPIKFKNPNDASSHGIGMVHQEFMLFSELTVWENIIMGYEPKRYIFIDRKRAKTEVERICQEYHFNIPLDKRVEELSVSMLQQVEIVKILYRGAEIIIFDEPTSVLTPQGIEGLFDAIRFLVKGGKTVLFITHKLKEVMEISDDISVLKNGKIIGTVLPESTNEQKLASMMVGRDVILTATKLDKKKGKKLLEISDITVRNADGKAKLKEVSLTIHEGEIVGIAGVAGSGQQELVEGLVGLQTIEAGSVLFDKVEVKDYSCRQIRKAGIGYVPQDRLKDGINKEGTLWENAIMGYHIVKGFSNRFLIGRKQTMEFTSQIMNEFSVKATSPYVKAKTLSGGNIQKLIVGREFLQDNKLLIIEDPTRGIDIGAIEFIWKKIEHMASCGAAILLVSHELNEVMEVSDTIKVMYDGRLYDGGAYKELTEEEIGLLMTGGKAHEAKN